ncbi:37S ribosomal protein MRP10 [Colletotrichum sidae]|uniref:Small ribosomal subunit protein mS37 n=4 Tax=Colletotrichum orbiculare species complex TaxID=2707354 RepID=N4VA28_COLOR|nr:37S ribosomal protein MRP10 [Colletotrichum orbiculare MAFF 240422]TDZ40462.1 37S ribosomal protein MRP10 [Colletotrichum spinosum]TDZ58534.1 37S ribosomal protein MRP10 [Colletotrichum trifolii]TEA15184.1 37S ribosomal protein MRP10 [Colletotrichum sidae]
MAKQPMRLPPLKVLRVKQPNKKPENPCIAVMSSVLACWASAGYNTQGCAALENALRTCMDQPAAPPQASSSINYHLNRMQDRVIPRSKEKKPVKNSI